MLGTSLALTLGSAALAISAAPVSTSSDFDKAQIEQIVHDYILNHPEILPEAMERLNAKKMGETVNEHRSAIETPYGNAWEGAANGDVVLVEFFDYACGYCRAALPDIAKLVAGDPKLKVVYRELPILSEESTQAARVSMLAAKSGNYMAFHKALYGAGRITPQSILAAAKTAGLDAVQAQAALNDKSNDSEIASNIALAQKLQASGTPTFVVGDKVFNGAVGYDALKSAIDAARTR